MNDDELAAISALAVAATGGPWIAYDMGDDVFDSENKRGWWWVWRKGVPHYAGVIEMDSQANWGDHKTPDGQQIGAASITDNRDGNQERADAEFIAAARSAVPALVAALAEARAENKRLREENAAHIERTIFQRGELGRLASALAEAHRTLADIGEPSWEYGHQLDNGLGWVFEPRGENYAMHRRKVWRGPAEWIDGTPLAASRSRAESGETR